MSQYSLFGAAAASATLADLDGVVLAGGDWVSSPRGTRLSVVVAQQWRAQALSAAFAELGVEAPDPVVQVGSAFGVRTAFAEQLGDSASRWRVGANLVPPAGLALAAPGLRLWAICSGCGDEHGYLLGTDHPDGPRHRAAGAQLSRLGLAAVSVGARGGPGWRVTSLRRLRRLAELLGEPPSADADGWPLPR